MKLVSYLSTLIVAATLAAPQLQADHHGKTLKISGAKGKAGSGKHAVLIAGDEEYRTEESMPMLAKILAKHHGFDTTVVFPWDKDKKFIDPNNQAGLLGLQALDSADLMIIGTRFRKPDEKGAAHIAKFLNEGKPVIGIRTATHAFNGDGNFGGLKYGDFGLKILGETWVSHHGKHKKEGARSVTEKGKGEHQILNGVGEIFAPSDVYGVIHLTDQDNVLLRAAVTETLDPKSKNVAGKQNDPMQAFAWLHVYDSPDGKRKGNAFCTTGGASVDLVDEDLRRLVVNASLYLTGCEVPEKANVAYVDPFYPSFYGFIREEGWFEKLDYQAEDFGLGKTPHSPDPKGTPEWNWRDKPKG